MLPGAAKDQQIFDVAVHALQRISRKPGQSFHHKIKREFFNAEGIVREVEDDVSTEDCLNPLWKPAWASEEYNECDCPKCIAVRALAEVEAYYKEMGVLSGH